MAQGYLTLQEAAKVLGMSADQLKQMAQKNQIRSFQDRGTWRFRAQDIEELARTRLGTSDPDLILGDASLSPRPGSGGPKSGIKSKLGGPKTPAKSGKDDDKDDSIFDFNLSADDAVDLGGPATPPAGSSSIGKKAPGSKPQPKSGVRKPDSKPAIMPEGSDSDVKLVADGSDLDFAVSRGRPESPRPAKGPSSGSVRAQPPSSSSRRRDPKPPDSGVRLVPMDSDSDVKIIGTGDDVQLGASPETTQADSNVRLERISSPPRRSEAESMSMTEEINLDEELKKAEAKAKQKPGKVRPKSELKMPPPSPFELSDSDIGEAPSELIQAKARPPKDDSSDFDLDISSPQEGSSDFDLSPQSSPTDDSDSIVLDDDVLGDDSPKMSGPSSGINLGKPGDAGISLESSDEDSNLDFDLSLEPDATPRPNPSEDASSEFELSLDLPTEEGSSEFELSLEPSGMDLSADSSSEFELTLDDSGLEESSDELPALQVKAKGKGKGKGKPAAEQGDIFETDFEVPGLDSDSSEAAVDTDLESSDFDLALDDSEIVADEESGSQVVALDEEEPSEVIAEEEITEAEGDFGDIEADGVTEAEGDDRPVREVIKKEMLQPAPWGVVPVLFMMPCAIVMLMVGMLGYEMIQSSVGMRNPGVLSRALGDAFGMQGLK